MIFNIQYKNDSKENIEKVTEGYNIAAKVLLSNEFLDAIKDTVRFTYTKDSTYLIATQLEMNVKLIVDGYAPMITVKDYFYKSKSVIATTFSSSPHSIFVNRHNTSRLDLEDYVGNGLHEFGHNPMDYKHGTNHPPGSWLGWIRGDREDKRLSVPHTFDRVGLEVARAKGWL